MQCHRDRASTPIVMINCAATHRADMTHGTWQRMGCVQVHDLGSLIVRKEAHNLARYTPLDGLWSRKQIANDEAYLTLLTCAR